MSWQPKAVEELCKIVHQETWSHQGSEVKTRLRNRMEAAFRAALLLIEVTPGMKQIGGEVSNPEQSLTSACTYAPDILKAMLTACSKEGL